MTIPFMEIFSINELLVHIGQVDLVGSELVNPSLGLERLAVKSKKKVAVRKTFCKNESLRKRYKRLAPFNLGTNLTLYLLLKL